MRRLLSTIAVLGLLTVGLAGCVKAAASPDEGEPALGTVGRPTTLAEVSLPLDAYIPTNEQRLALVKANDLLTKDCMARFGLNFQLLQRGLWTFDPVRDTRFVFIDEAQAARYGYHRPPDVGNEERSQQARALSAAMSPDEIAVVGGRTGRKSYNGQAIPDGGCLCEARRRLAAGGPDVDEQLVDRLGGEANVRWQQDSRIQAIGERWSTCMKQAGYPAYRTPDDAINDHRWEAEPHPSPQQINTAVAHARCEREVNWLGVAAAVATAYQQREVERQAESLTAFGDAMQTKLRTAAAVLTGTVAG
jgi:hypothetical protein